MSLKLAVFDWNGTLFDDTHFVVQALNEEEAGIFGIPPVTMEQYREFYDVPIRDMYERLGVAPEKFEAVHKEASKSFEVHYEPLALQAKTREGVHDLLRYLNDNGIECVILSNHTVSSIVRQLERFELDEKIQAILANDVIGGGYFKGKQDRLSDYIVGRAISKQEVVIVGDTPEEVRIAKNLEQYSIAVTGGACSELRLEAVQPDYLVTSLYKVQKIMEGMI